MEEKNWILNISSRRKEVTQIRKKGDLTKHITSVHEGEKPWIKFDCSYCDKKFQNEMIM